MKLRVAGCGLLLGFILAGCAGMDDVSFARKATALLVKGRYSARHMLDWQTLRFMNVDVGSEYKKFTDKKERMGYEMAFVENFSKGFKSQGAKFSAFFNWRVQKSDNPDVRMVAANCHDVSNVFLFSIANRGGKKKIIEISALHTLSQEEADKINAGRAERAGQTQ